MKDLRETKVEVKKTRVPGWELLGGGLGLGGGARIELEIDQTGARKLRVGKKRLHLPRNWSDKKQSAFINALLRKRVQSKSNQRQIVTALPPQIPADLVRSWALSEAYKNPTVPAALPPPQPRLEIKGEEAKNLLTFAPRTPVVNRSPVRKVKEEPLSVKAAVFPLTVRTAIELFATPPKWRGYVRNFAKENNIEIKASVVNAMSSTGAFHWLKEHNAPVVHEFLDQRGKGQLVADKTGFVGLSTDDINKFMKRYPEYVGTLPFDGLKRLVPTLKPGQVVATVMNTEKAGQSGQHWFALLVDPVKSKSVEYYDSYGQGIPETLLSDIKQVVDAVSPDTYLKLKENKIRRQGNSNDCGFFAMKFLMDRFRGIPFPECTGYDDQVRGQKAISEFKQQPQFKYLI
jgi:hypothetical protein